VHFILIKSVLSDHLSYITLIQCSLERLHKTGLTVSIYHMPLWLWNLIVFHMITSKYSSENIYNCKIINIANYFSIAVMNNEIFTNVIIINIDNYFRLSVVKINNEMFTSVK
jgi:hypothetical protein